MRPHDRDTLLEATPLERDACLDRLLAMGYSPGRILAEAPYLSPALVEGRGGVEVLPARAPSPTAN